MARQEVSTRREVTFDPLWDHLRYSSASAEAKRKDLTEKYPGQWVAVSGNRFLEVAEDTDSLIEKIRQRGENPKGAYFTKLHVRNNPAPQK